jgi:secreted Zn-dependent insulinase-like peptidase
MHRRRAQYSTGNLKTLRDDLPEGWDTRSELLKFHQASGLRCAACAAFAWLLVAATSG